ncbi:hypothetical protein JCM18899A_14040 [Nocardioides sp. AN3]
MSIPTQMSLAGFIASAPELHFTETGHARMYTRVGVEHYRKEADGTFTKLDPSYHDLVMFNTAAEKAYDRFRPGDSFIASGYIHEYEVERTGSSLIKEEFVARKIGHDTHKTSYQVHRRQTAIEEAPTPAAPTATAPIPTATPTPSPAARL